MLINRTQLQGLESFPQFGVNGEMIGVQNGVSGEQDQIGGVQDIVREVQDVVRGVQDGVQNGMGGVFEVQDGTSEVKGVQQDGVKKTIQEFAEISANLKQKYRAVESAADIPRYILNKTEHYTLLGTKSLICYSFRYSLFDIRYSIFGYLLPLIFSIGSCLKNTITI